MAFNGSGVFSRLYNWVTDRDAGINILATRMDAETDGIATGLSTCITKDGQTTVTANLPMATFKHTGVGNATATNQYLAAGQAIANSLGYAATTGSANAYAVALSIAPAAYTAGMIVSFKASFANTAAATINVNSLGAKTIKKYSTSDLAANDIVSGQIVTLIYESTADVFQMITPLGNKAIATGTHTIWVPATAILSRFTTGSSNLNQIESVTGDPDIISCDFDPTTQQYAQFNIMMPKSWDRGTITAQFYWSHPATTTNFGVVWNLAGVAVSDDDTIAVAFGTAQQIADTGGTTNDLYVTAATPAITITGSPAVADLVFFQVSRVVADGSDTMAVNARLAGVAIFCNISAENDN
jgi:hypothetical protein